MTVLAIPAGATTATMFRCEHWACTLAFKGCLLRQGERFEKKGATKGKRWTTRRAQHPYCANTCEDGRAIAAHFGGAERTVVSLSGFGTLVKHHPRKEKTMTKKKRTRREAA